MIEDMDLEEGDGKGEDTSRTQPLFSGGSSAGRFGPVPSLQALALNAMPQSFKWYTDTESERSYHRKTIEIMKFNRSIAFEEDELEKLNVAYSYVPCDLWLPKRLHCYVPETYVGTLQNRDVKSRDFLALAKDGRFSTITQSKTHLDVFVGEDVVKIPIIHDPHWKCKSLEVKFEYLSVDDTFFVITCEDDQFHPSHPFSDFRRNLKSHEEYAIPKPVVKMQFKITFSDLNILTENPEKNASGIQLEMVNKGLAAPFSLYTFSYPFIPDYDAKFRPKEPIDWDITKRDNPIVKDGDGDFKLRLFKDSHLEEDTVFSIRYYYSPQSYVVNYSERGGRGSLRSDRTDKRDEEEEEEEEYVFRLTFDRKMLETWRNHVNTALIKNDNDYLDRFRLENVDPLLLRDIEGGMESQLPSYLTEIYELADDSEREEMMKLLNGMMYNKGFGGDGSFCSTFTFTDKYCAGTVDNISDESMRLNGEPIIRISGLDLTLIGYGTGFRNKHVKLGSKDYVYFQCNEDRSHAFSNQHVRDYYRYHHYRKTDPLSRSFQMWYSKTFFPRLRRIREDQLRAMTYADPDYGVDLTIALNYEDLMNYGAYWKRRSDRPSDPKGVLPEIRTKVWGAVCDCRFEEYREPDEGKWNTKYAYFDGNRTEVFLRPEIFHDHSGHVFPVEPPSLEEGNGNDGDLTMIFHYTGDLSDTDRVLNFRLSTERIRKWKSAHDEYENQVNIFAKEMRRRRKIT